MTNPFFTIAIPTKNRPDQLRDAITSVLSQSFTDLELIVCDNSDESEAPGTAATVHGFADERIRYIRTGGLLSMPDNWERAIADARGDFVGILTDRSVFRPSALETVRREIERTDARCVSWFNDLYGGDSSGSKLKRRATTSRRYQLASETVVEYFLRGHPKRASKIVPKLMTAVCHRSILDAMRSSPAGRCCLPVAPDFTSGFLILSQCDWILTIDEALYVSCGSGTGAAFRRNDDLADRFRRDLGMSWTEIVDRMPSQARFSHALVLNDFVHVRDLVGGRLAAFDIDRPQYYLGCLFDYVKTARRGVYRRDQLDLLLAALASEPRGVQHRVRTTHIYDIAMQTLSPEAKPAPEEKGWDEDGAPFSNVFEALAWDEANPREPAESGFMDTMPGVDSVSGNPAITRLRRRLRLRTRLRQLAQS